MVTDLSEIHSGKRQADVENGKRITISDPLTIDPMFA
jgi:putative ubiquitin-RnfH superfamily antitoxin RatB of RatAB toxin-antitoxin module